MRVTNWEKWQSYRKDRGQPPWIKVHRALLRNPEWIRLSDAQRGQLISMWMLAADKDGVLPDCPKLIQKLCFLDNEPEIKLFCELNFLDAKVTPKRRQAGARSTPQNRVEEKRVEDDAKDGVTPPKRASEVPENWAPLPAQIDRLKAQGHTVETIGSELIKFRNHHRAKGSLFKRHAQAFDTWMQNAKEWAAKSAKAGARKNGTGWYISTDSAEYDAWCEWAKKICDWPLHGRLKAAKEKGEVHVRSRWPSAPQ